MLEQMKLEQMHISLLYHLTDRLGDYIVSLAKDSKKCDRNLRRKEIDFIRLIVKLKRMGLRMDELMEYCVMINLQRCTKDDYAVEECEKKATDENKNHQDGHDCSNCTIDKRKNDLRKCRTVKDFLMLGVVSAITKDDLRKTFHIKSFVKSPTDNDD